MGNKATLLEKYLRSLKLWSLFISSFPKGKMNDYRDVVHFLKTRGDDPTALRSAFNYRTTKQGERYWRIVSDGFEEFVKQQEYDAMMNAEL